MVPQRLTDTHRRHRPLRAAVTAAATVAVAALSGPIAYASGDTVTSAAAPHRLSTPLPPVTVPVGKNPFGIVADRASGTIYVATGAGVALIDGTGCNARVHTGCWATPITTAVGHGNIGITLDPTTHTVYVASGSDNAVGVIDTTTCSARTTAGCAGPHLRLRSEHCPATWWPTPSTTPFTCPTKAATPRDTPSPWSTRLPATGASPAAAPPPRPPCPADPPRAG